MPASVSKHLLSYLFAIVADHNSGLITQAKNKYNAPKNRLVVRLVSQYHQCLFSV